MEETRAEEERSTQLTLLETPPDWRLDERTREVGRRGVARAREALRAALATRRRDGDDNQRDAA
jgi:hypothetical protein